MSSSYNKPANELWTDISKRIDSAVKEKYGPAGVKRVNSWAGQLLNNVVRQTEDKDPPKKSKN